MFFYHEDGLALVDHNSNLPAVVQTHIII